MEYKKDVDFMMLFPPNMDYEYFQWMEKVPFDGETKGFSLATAWYLAESSLLVYEHPGFIKWVLRYIGAENYRFFGKDVTEAAVFTLGKNCIVAFRGTEVKSLNFVPDVITDIRFSMVDFCDRAGTKKGSVHKGFKLAFDELLDDTDDLPSYLDSLLDSGKAKHIFFTGHSMGGALATLAAGWYPRSVAPLYTWGAPRVGNREFCAGLPVKAWRCVIIGDPVPYLPPNLPGMDTPEKAFDHVGTFLYYNEKKQLLADPVLAAENIVDVLRQNVNSAATGIFKQIRNTFKGRKTKDPGELIRAANLTSHAPVLYSLYSWNFLAERKFSPRFAIEQKK